MAAHRKFAQTGQQRPAVLRTVAFGDGGLITYIESERRQLVVVEQVAWVA